MVISKGVIAYGKSGTAYRVVEANGSNLTLVFPDNTLRRVDRDAIQYWHPPKGSLAWSYSGKAATVIGALHGRVQLLFLNGKSKEVEASRVAHWQMLKPSDLQVGDKTAALLKDQSWAVVEILSRETPEKPQPGRDYAYIPGCGLYTVKILRKQKKNSQKQLITHDKGLVA